MARLGVAKRPRDDSDDDLVRIAGEGEALHDTGIISQRLWWGGAATVTETDGVGDGPGAMLCGDTLAESLAEVRGRSVGRWIARDGMGDGDALVVDLGHQSSPVSRTCSYAAKEVSVVLLIALTPRV